MREAETALQQSATELGKLTREMIQSGKDSDFQLPASVAGRGMDYEEARKFNGSEMRAFIASEPSFFDCPENREALIDYLLRQDCVIADAATYQAAFLRLREYGLLEERPEPEPIQEPPKPQPVAEPTPEVFKGVDPATGLEREFSRREVQRMDSLTYRKAFGLYGENGPTETLRASLLGNRLP